MIQIVYPRRCRRPDRNPCSVDSAIIAHFIRIFEACNQIDAIGNFFNIFRIFRQIQTVITVKLKKKC